MGLKSPFTGKFDGGEPLDPVQVETAKLFLDVAVNEGKLEACYTVSLREENGALVDVVGQIQRDLWSECRKDGPQI